MGKLTGLTDSEITDLCGEFGEVTSIEGHSKGRGTKGKYIPIRYGLYDPVIFGVPAQFNCRCGGQRRRPGRCPVCKELLVKEDDWVNHLGYYSLSVPYISIIKKDKFIEQLRNIVDVNKINSIGKKYGIKDIIGSIWNSEFILSKVDQVIGDEFGYIVDSNEVIYKLDVIEANETSKYSNCGLTGLYRIFYNYKLYKSNESLKYMLEYINHKLLIAPVQMRPIGVGFNDKITYPKLSTCYALIMSLDKIAKQVIYGEYGGNEGSIADKLAISYNINRMINLSFETLSILAQSHDSMIRYANTGRLPCSGRANIITADVSVDTVLLPVSLAYESLKDQIIKKLKSLYSGTNYNPEDLYMNPNKEVMEIFEDIVNNSVVVINRQPTLYKYGMLAFHARLWKDTDLDYPTDTSKIACIGMNTMVCSPFNADFDGDQMAYYIFTDEIDKAKVWDRMSVNNNWFYEKNSEPIFVPNKSTLLGLHVGTKLKLPSDLTKVPVVNSFEELEMNYNNNLIKFNDPVSLDYEYTTYGIEKLSNILHMDLKDVLKVKSNAEVTINSKNVCRISSYISNMPDKIDILNALFKVGNEFIMRYGTSIINLGELYKAQPEFPEIKEILESNMSEKEKWIKLSGDNLKKIIMKNTELLMPTLYEQKDAAKIKDNSIIESLTPVIKFKDNHVIVKNESLVSGLSEEEFITHAENTRAILKQKAQQIPMSGYMTRQLIDLFHNYIYKADIKSNDTIGILVKRKHAVGRYTLDNKIVNTPSKNEENELVRIKSCVNNLVKGKERYYIASDELNQSLYNPRNNDAIGISIAGSFTEQFTQAQLGLKHGGTLLSLSSDKLIVNDDLDVVEIKDDRITLGKGLDRFIYPLPVNKILSSETINGKLKSGDVVYYIDRLDFIDYNIKRTASVIGAALAGNDFDIRSSSYVNKIGISPVEGDIHYDFDRKRVTIGNFNTILYDNEVYYKPEGTHLKLGDEFCSGYLSPGLINQMCGNNYELKFQVFYHQIDKLMNGKIQILPIELMFKSIFCNSSNNISSAIANGDPMVTMIHQKATGTLTKILDKDIDYTLATAIVLGKNNRSGV